MERARIVNGLRAILTQERFTATRIGSPGCRIRKVAEENIEALDPPPPVPGHCVMADLAPGCHCKDLTGQPRDGCDNWRPE